MSEEYTQSRMGKLSAMLLPFIFACTFIAACDNPDPSPQQAAPSAVADAYSIASGMTLSRSAPGVLANDGVSESAIAMLVSPAKFGTVDLREDGSFSFTPTYKFTGLDSFTYQVFDGEYASEPIPVRITFPNVVVIVVDDMGLGDLGPYNNYSITDTPNLTAFAEAGITFTHAHSPAAVCSPSRYSILTGNYPYRGRISSGIWHSYQPSTMLMPGQATLGNIFRDSGFRTGFVGKLHNGGAFWNVAGTDYTMSQSEIDFTRKFDRGPTQFGFDYSFLLPGGVSGRPYAYFEDDRLVRFDEATGEYEQFTSNKDVAKHFVFIDKGWGAVHNGGVVGISTWAMDNFDSRKSGAILTRKALGFLDRAISESESLEAPKPFFLFFAPPQLHVPNSPPEYFNVTHTIDSEPATDGTPVAGTTASARIDMIREVDLMVGAIVEFLEERGQLENTLIVFSSDNGPVIWPVVENRDPTGTEDGTLLRGMKGLIHEGGHRVPLLARWGHDAGTQSVIAPRTTSGELVGLQDLAATFHSLLGQQRPFNQANDSKSMLPVLLGTPSESAPLRNHLIVQGSPYDYDNANRIDRGFYKRDSAGDLWKLTVVSSNTDPVADITWREFYNLSKDPGESTDLIDYPDSRKLLDAMKAEYLDLIVQPQTIVSFR